MRDADVIIVGFRCAGAPLALALHRAGLKVIALEADAFFTDQPLSTHAIQPFGMRLFDRLGLGDLIRELAPRNEALRFQVDDDYMQVDLRGTDLDARSPRRSVLDPALQRTVLEWGVDARERTRVIDLLREGDRVVGVRVKTPEGESRLHAPLVVGADGRSSSVARLVESPAYIQSSTPNGMYWSYFEKPRIFDDDPNYDWGACIHREGDEARAVFLTDSDLLLIAGGGLRQQVRHWGRDPRTHLLEHLRRGTLTGPLVAESRMVSRPIGMLSSRFFMKRAVGPGWALVGDAGLHMDPTPGMGITDAVRDAIALADAIVDGSEQALHVYWRQRDAETIALYHFVDDMGSENHNNPLTRMIFRRSQADPDMRARMLAMMDRELSPLEVLPPARVLRYLAAETLSGRLGPWAHLGASLGMSLRAARHQAFFDRALDRARRGQLDFATPRYTRSSAA